MLVLQSKVTVELERCKSFEGASYITQRLVDVDVDVFRLVVASDCKVGRALRDNRRSAGLGPVWKSISESGAPIILHEVFLGDGAAVMLNRVVEDPRHRAGTSSLEKPRAAHGDDPRRSST